MTRDELIEKVAQTMCDEWGYLWDGDPDDYQVIAEESEPYDDRPSRKIFRLAADGVINTIFDALKEPTDEMCFAGGEYVLSVGSIDCMHAHDRPEFGMKGRETGSYELFQAMLSASPLAPEE